MEHVFREEIRDIRECDALIIVLSDTMGIYLEAGYAKALGKKIIGLRVEETREFTGWSDLFFDHMVSSADGLINVLKSLGG